MTDWLSLQTRLRDVSSWLGLTNLLCKSEADFFFSVFTTSLYFHLKRLFLSLRLICSLYLFPSFKRMMFALSRVASPAQFMGLSSNKTSFIRIGKAKNVLLVIQSLSSRHSFFGFSKNTTAYHLGRYSLHLLLGPGQVVQGGVLIKGSWCRILTIGNFIKFCKYCIGCLKGPKIMKRSGMGVF